MAQFHLLRLSPPPSFLLWSNPTSWLTTQLIFGVHLNFGVWCAHENIKMIPKSKSFARSFHTFVQNDMQHTTFCAPAVECGAHLLPIFHHTHTTEVHAKISILGIARLLNSAVYVRFSLLCNMHAPTDLLPGHIVFELENLLTHFWPLCPHKWSKW